MLVGVGVGQGGLTKIVTGAMKSFIVLLKELPEERLFSQALPNVVPHPVGGSMPAPVRLMPASPMVFAATVPPNSGSASGVVPV